MRNAQTGSAEILAWVRKQHAILRRVEPTDEGGNPLMVVTEDEVVGELIDVLGKIQVEDLAMIREYEHALNHVVDCANCVHCRGLASGALDGLNRSDFAE